MSESDSNFRVYVRCRLPLASSDESATAYEPVPPRNITRIVGPEKTYSFDRVFDSHSEQSEIFDVCAQPLIDDFLRGFNATMFAYGQTGTGKTYTMIGECNDPSSTQTAGVIPRVLSSVFKSLNEWKGRDWSLELKYVELYNEDLRDLLDTSPAKPRSAGAKPLRIIENRQTRSVEVVGATTTPVSSLQSALGVVKGATARRQTAATNMNSDSSRSHAVLTLILVVRESGNEMAVRSKLHLVDLAGSESVGRSGAMKQRAYEAGEINKSLLSLGRVIERLVSAEKQGGSHTFVSYRESKLTQLLQDSLGGPTRTAMIATISLALRDTEESRSTLDYASRARSIKNQPQIEPEVVQAQETLRDLSQRLEEAQQDLRIQRNRDGGVYVDNNTFQQLKSSQKRYAELLALKESLANRYGAEIESHQAQERTLKKQLAAQQTTLQDLQRQLRVLEDEHSQCSLVAESHSQLRDLASSLNGISSKYTQTAAEVIGALNKHFSKIPDEISRQVSELRTVLGSGAFDNSRLTEATTAETRSIIRLECQAVEESLQSTLNLALRQYRDSSYVLKENLEKSHSLSGSLVDRIDALAKELNEQRRSGEEISRLTRAIRSHDDRHFSQMTRAMQQYKDERQALVEQISSSQRDAQLDAFAGQIEAAKRDASDMSPLLASLITPVMEYQDLDITRHFQQLSSKVEEAVKELAGEDSRAKTANASAPLHKVAEELLHLKSRVVDAITSTASDARRLSDNKATMLEEISKVHTIATEQFTSRPGSQGGVVVAPHTPSRAQLKRPLQSPLRSPLRSPQHNSQRNPLRSPRKKLFHNGSLNGTPSGDEHHSSSSMTKRTEPKPVPLLQPISAPQLNRGSQAIRPSKNVFAGRAYSPARAPHASKSGKKPVTVANARPTAYLPPPRK